jgi:hypothetical protein
VCSEESEPLKVVGDTLTVTLKWSREKPIEVPVVRVMLNGVDAADAGFTVVSADNIAVKDRRLRRRGNKVGD